MNYLFENRIFKNNGNIFKFLKYSYFKKIFSNIFHDICNINTYFYATE